MRQLDVVTPSGLHLGKRDVLLFDRELHDMMIARIVRGLYFWRFGEVLAPWVRIRPMLFDRLDQSFVEAFSGCTQMTIGGGQFMFLSGRAEEGFDCSIWLLGFYQRHWAGAITNELVIEAQPLPEGSDRVSETIGAST
jgi:hypothetical protein